MIVVIRYGDGGYEPGADHDNAAEWADTTARVRWQCVDGKPVSRPFNTSENAVADAMGRDDRAGIAATAALIKIAALADAANPTATAAVWRASVDRSLATIADALTYLASRDN